MFATEPPPIIEAYYLPACAPCRLELPALVEFAHKSGARVRIVIVSEERRARAELMSAAPSLAETAIVGKGASPRAILEAAGDKDGILPYARSLNSSGKICATWRGRLSVAKAGELVAACTRAFTSHRPQRS